MQKHVTVNVRAAVYRLFDASGALLYVGKADKPETRWADHERQADWWPAVASKTVEWFESHDEALAAEREAIASEQPVHNKVHVAGWHPNVNREPKPALGVPASELRTDSSRLLSEVQHLGCSTLITRNNKPIAALVPLSVLKRAALADAYEAKYGPLNEAE